jgi:hypothetical protein
MTERDIHLAAAAISDNCRGQFEDRGFEEDFFRECKNCTPTLYHATYRADPERIGDGFWSELTGLIQRDAQFNGLLEQEWVLGRTTAGAENPHTSVPPIATQPCPPGRHKACDVHIGARLAGGERTLHWLEQLGIASFQKTRPDGEWRIHTATFDGREAGELFFQALDRLAPRPGGTVFKMKIEMVERALRYPLGAATLPLTYTQQLYAWLEAVEGLCSSKSLSDRPQRHGPTQNA